MGTQSRGFVMTLTSKSDGGVLEIGGILNIETADSLRDLLFENLSLQSGIVLDLSAVEECDTAALQVLLACEKSAAASGKKFEVVHGAPAITDTASALGFSFFEDSQVTGERNLHAA